MEIIILIIFLVSLYLLDNSKIENFGNQLLLPDFTNSIFVGRDVYNNDNNNIKYDEQIKPSEVEDVKQPPYSQVDFDNLIGDDDNPLRDRELYTDLENIHENLKSLEALNLENKYLNKAICGKRNMQIVNPTGSYENLLTRRERSFIKSIEIPETCLWSEGKASEDGDPINQIEAQEGCGYNTSAICSQNILTGNLADDEIKEQCKNKDSAIWRYCKRFCCQNLLFPPNLEDTPMSPDQEERYELFTNENDIKPFTIREIIYGGF